MKLKLVILSIALIFGACSSTPKKATRYVPNQTYKSKIALRRAHIDVRLLSVKLEGNTLNVSGFVSTDEEREKAEEVISKIYPKVSVQNFLIVK